MKIFTAALITTIISFLIPEKTTPGIFCDDNQGQAPLFSFGIITDVQYCDCDPVGTRYYRSSLLKLEEAVKILKSNEPEFVFDLGDLIDKDFLSYKAVYGILDTSELKIYHCTGNHDYSVEPRLKKRIPPLQFSKEGYYTFAYDKFRFIVLNGNELSTYSTNNKSIIKQADDYITKLKNGGEINATNWNGGISSKQLDWLTIQLNSAVKNSEKVFIMCHFPVYPVNVHNLLNYKEVLTLLEKYNNIIAWFNGHNHTGNYGNHNMVHFVTIKGMVETKDINSFALVEVYRNKIWIKGTGREKSQILAY
jgi:manganese-dependent ADP-ribose/CDP-alcohol diphosphatase